MPPYRCDATGRKVYVVKTRGPTGSLRRVTIGRDTKMTAEAARRTAAEVIDRISSGEDPFPAPPTPEPTVADLAERYMKAHVEVNCRPGGTVGIFRRVVEASVDMIDKPLRALPTAATAPMGGSIHGDSGGLKNNREIP